MRPLHITVTRDHIKRGCKGSTMSCPIAIALKEALLTHDVQVKPSDLRINQVSYGVPSSLKRFIERFDEGKIVRPLKFRVCRN